MKTTDSFLRRNGPAFVLTAAVLCLTYAVVLRFRSAVTDAPSDYLPHALYAIVMTPQAILSSFYDGSEHLWYIFVKLFHSLTGNLWTAAAAVTAAANAAAAFVLCKLMDRLRPARLSRWGLAALLMILFTADALTLPGWDHYISAGGINTWHNPTNIMVRPFAAAVFYMTARIYDRRRVPGEPGAVFRFEGGFWRQFRTPVYRGAEVVLYPLCILFSAYAKPSFLQFFAPAIFLFLLIDVIRTRGKLLPFCLKLALAYLPAAVILLMQFTSFFQGGISVASAAESGEAAAGAGIAVYFLRPSFDGAAALFSALGSKLLSILRVSAFPLLILAVAPRGFFRDTACRLGFIGAAVGRAESMLLHETGQRAAQGNFLWGQYLSAWLFWSAALVRYAALLREDSAAGKLARWVGSPLLAWHFFSGVLYLIRILQTGEYFL